MGICVVCATVLISPRRYMHHRRRTVRVVCQRAARPYRCTGYIGLSVTPDIARGLCVRRLPSE